MTYHVDGLSGGMNPHVNYEPSSLGGLKEAPTEGKPHTPHYDASLVREPIDRTNDFGQAGEKYRSYSDAERDELINNLVGALSQCKRDIQDRMISHFSQADADYGRRVAEGLGRTAPASNGNGAQAVAGRASAK